MSEKSNIYTAICSIIGDIGAIEKSKTNKEQGFKYRGIDDVMNALQPMLAKYHVFVVPTVLEQQRDEKTTKAGSPAHWSIFKIKFTFYAEDGSSIEAVTIGESMDTGDKGSNKAMAIAFKYALFQVFCIPTEEMPDPDADSPELGKPTAQAKPSVSNMSAPADVITKGQDNPDSRFGAKISLDQYKKLCVLVANPDGTKNAADASRLSEIAKGCGYEKIKDILQKDFNAIVDAMIQLPFEMEEPTHD